MVKVSVIIPAYNAAKYIKDAIDSVLNQTYKNIEVIIVDDGSDDKTREVAESYCAVPGVCYIYQANKGPGAARNTGIKAAKGGYIAFLDSDDLWMAEKLEKQVKALENSEYAMVYCDMRHVEYGEIIYKSYLKEKKYKYVSSGYVYKNLLRENFIFTPTVLAKKEVFEKVGYFDESYRICEDYKMWLKITRDYKVCYMDEALVERRRNSLNITRDKFLFINSGIRLFEELLSRHDESVKLTGVIKEEYYRRFYDLGYYYWDMGEIIVSRENFIKAMRCKKNILRAVFYAGISYFPKTWIKVIRGMKSVFQGYCLRRGLLN